MKRKTPKPRTKTGRTPSEPSARPARATPARASSATSGKRTAASGRTAQVKPGTERARDEERTSGGPRYGGGPWAVADARGEQRFGKARNDDAEPSELAARDADNDDDDSPLAADPELAAAEAAGEIEGSGQHAGMGRGDKPRKPKSRAR